VGRFVKNVYRTPIKCLNESFLMYLVYTNFLQYIENWESKIWTVCECNGADVQWRAVRMSVVPVGYTVLLKWTVN
jgi:hypothetical protein